jgi:hypothetical protein
MPGICDLPPPLPPPPPTYTCNTPPDGNCKVLTDGSGQYKNMTECVAAVTCKAPPPPPTPTTGLGYDALLVGLTISSCTTNVILLGGLGLCWFQRRNKESPLEQSLNDAIRV